MRRLVQPCFLMMLGLFLAPVHCISGCSRPMEQPLSSQQTETPTTPDLEPKPKASSTSSNQQPSNQETPSERGVPGTAELTSNAPRKSSAEAIPSNSTSETDRSPVKTVAPSGNAAVETDPAKSSRGAGKRKKPEDASATLKTVNTLRENARQATKNKDYGKAFSLVSQAWEATRTHPKDAALQRIAAELAEEIETLSQQANAKFQRKAASSDTLLIEQ